MKYWEIIADNLSRAGGGFESQLSGECVHEKPHHGIEPRCGFVKFK
jgi:hypothetical protein